VKRFSIFTGSLAVLVAATVASAFEPVILEDPTVDLQPTSVASLWADEAHRVAKDSCYDCCECCQPAWSVYVGAVILNRDNPSNFRAFDLGWHSGVDVDIRRRLGTDHQLQVRYFGVDDWDDQLSGFPVPPADFYYSSSLHSTEFNLRRDWTDRVNLLAGFRWVELHEETGFQGPPGLVQNNNTDNHMYGFQIGADWLAWDRGGPFTVTAGAKAGIYYNRADYDASLRRNFPAAVGGPPLIGSARKDHTAFLGELAVTGAYRLNDNWAVLAGYQLLWIEGVATADATAVDLAAGIAAVNTSGSPFYHGATVGVELRY